MSSISKKFLAQAATLLFFVFLAVWTSDALAQTPPGGEGFPPGEGYPSVSVDVTLDNPFGSNNDLYTIMKSIVNNILLPIGGVLAVLAFIYSGFLYVIAQGNEDKVKKAHQALLYSSIGTAILLGSWVIANLICATIGQLGGPICPSP